MKFIALITITLVFATITLFFGLRNIILRKIIDQRLHAIETRYNLKFGYSNAHFSGIRTIEIQNFAAITPALGTQVVQDTLSNQNIIQVPKSSSQDSLFRINILRLSFKPVSLILGDLKITNLNLINTLINLKREGDKSNYLFLLDKKKGTTIKAQTPQIENKYGLRVSRLMNALFNLIPSSISINEFRINALLDQREINFYLPRLDIGNHIFNTTVNITEENETATWKVNGTLDSENHEVLISFSGTEEKITIPYIKKRWNTIFSFDSAAISFSFEKLPKDLASLHGSVYLKEPLLNHPRISPSDVKVENGEVDFSVLVGDNFFEIDSSTLVSFNKIGFHPYVKYSILPEKRIDIRINEPDIDAADFFESLPAGMFTNLEGIKVKGSLNFMLEFNMAVNNPDSLLFESKLRSRNFRVQQFGKTNLAFINGPFIYIPYENGYPVREILIGEENPNYRALDQIPANLKYAIMTSEDGQFYNHNGFVPDAIRHSIITNIKEKRFARGGSTISMQLVKNIFLNRSKHITRKLEEMLITWIIESQRLVSKDRMFEVYLNIIETGPMTYGVNEAAHFYFKKDVSKLTLAESIYIASIVPRPKLFKYSFDKEGNLREYLSNYYSLVSGKMLSRGWITEYEYENLSPEIILTGPARQHIVTDSVPAPDEIIKERKGLFDFFKLNIFKRKKKEDSQL